MNIVDSQNDNTMPIYEAVFTNGKGKVKPIEGNIQEIKDILDEEIKKQTESDDYNFDPQAFWKNKKFKELEDQVKNIFGFRHVTISPFIETYNSKDKQFKSKVMNCAVYHCDRFPIDGLITESGFYDKTHSVVMEIYISLGLIKELTSAEILAVLLHEFGHGIDPAITTIEYAETSILSKYMTDRKTQINDKQEKAVKKKHKLGIAIPIMLIILATYSAMIIGFIISKISNLFMGFIGKGDNSKHNNLERKLRQIRDLIKKDEDFNRKTSIEAYADNFARMYGYAGPLMSGISKADEEMKKQLKSRFKKESERRKAICEIAISCIKDVHKTDVHRIRALIKEYEEDLKDPNYSAAVKKQIKEDKEELEKVLDKYLNHYSELQKTINRTIYEELEKKDATSDKKEEKDNDDKKK